MKLLANLGLLLFDLKKIKSEKARKFTLVKILSILFMGAFMCSSSAFAANFGKEITIYDGIGSNGSGSYQEDNEAEPGMVQSQNWDLEGFFINNKALTIVGGYNFYTGQDGIKAGDIFIDTNRDAVYSPNVIPGYNYNPGYNLVSNNLFKYDYVLHINWSTGSYDIIKLDGNSILKDTLYGEAYNKGSNPWIYVSGGNVISTQSFNNYGKTSQSDTGYLGWAGNNNHYAATFNLDGVDMSSGALFHNTMECGNDNLLGLAGPVPTPEPSSMILGLLSFSGLFGIKRRKA